MAKTKSCRHNWKTSYFSGRAAALVCRKCQEHRDIQYDATVSKAYRTYAKVGNAEFKQLYRTWHAFERRFKNPDTGEWKLTGYDFMQAVERWAKRRPDVHVLGTDDSYFATSSLVLVEHKTERQFMGITVVFIPQCAPGPPTEFILCPCHAEPLYRLLKSHKQWRDQKWDPASLPEEVALDKAIMQKFRSDRKKS